MARTYPHPLRRKRYLLLSMLLILAAIAWGILIWQADRMNTQAMGLTMGMSAELFIAIWAVMMVAMMVPAAAPMILTFYDISAGKQQRSSATIWVFAGAYLLIWIVSGVLAYALALEAEMLAGQSMWLMENAARFGGLILVLAGLYQFSPPKHIFISKCRTPLQCILDTWRDGYFRALRGGLEQGAYCLGCCWLLFVILFPLGIMNIIAMVLLTLLIFAEKSLPHGQQISHLVGGGFIVYGVLVMFLPALLPMGM